MITLAYDKFEGPGVTGDVISEEGATCWFADPRSLAVKSEDGAVNRTYIGYIDNHGSVKASQYDNLTGKMDEVLVRSNFQPDDHNNPTFLELPDHRIMIFYSRHTDEPCFYYRVSKEPYDITALGEEKYLATANNTTYPNPFILSDDPDHIYLGWRGINWHPTLGRLTLPDENDNVTLELEKQIVQSTGARPYAKYTSNGKDEIWVTYTTGHPDNEDPNWLYFNKININTLDVTDIAGNVLSNVGEAPLSVNKTDDASRAIAVSSPSGGTRDWVWEIVNDNGTPVIAMVKIDGGKTNHNYYCATYRNGAWQETFLTYAGGKFHVSNTEYCYSGGMTIDKANPHVFYCSLPVKGVFGDVFEIVKFTLSEDYSTVEKTEYITENSKENNVRPYIANGSAEGDLRLTWMNGQYFFWINDQRNHGPNGESGFPTNMRTLTHIPEQAVVNTLGESNGQVYSVSGNTVSFDAPKGEAFTISMELLQSDLAAGGTLLNSGGLNIALEKQTVDPYDYAAVAPNVTAGAVSQKSQNLFSNSDWFSWGVNGTGGNKGVNNMGWINYAVTYDGTDLVTYVNGLVDTKLTGVSVALGEAMEIGGIDGIIANVRTADTALTQAEIKASLGDFDEAAVKTVDTISLEGTENVISDMILPATAYNGSVITWTSSDEGVITATGAVTRDAQPHTVVLTAEVDGEAKDFTVTVAAKESVNENLLFKYNFNETYDKDGVTMVKDAGGNGLDGEIHGTAASLADGKLDLTANTADGWDTNGYVNVPHDFLKGVRSYTVVQQVKGGSSTHPRLYDFGSNNQNSVFTRADAFSAGIKNGGTQLVDASTTSIPSDKEHWIVTSYNAATGMTRLYLDGELVADSAAITHEAYTAAGGTTRNYIGRTQWWDYGSWAADNQDFNGTIDNFMFFNAALTEEEIAEVTSASVSAEPALSIKNNEDGTVTLGIGFTAKVAGNSDLAESAGFDYAAYEKDADGNYTVMPEEVKNFEFKTLESDSFRLTISGISNANSARVYAAKPYIVVNGEKVYGETVTATLYGQIIDSIVYGSGNAILPERLTAANSVIAFVKANRKDNSAARFPGLAEASGKLYGADGEIVEKAAKLGIIDDASAIVNSADVFVLETVELEFVDESAEEVQFVTDITVDLDFDMVM